MSEELNKTLLTEIRNLSREIEALEFQITEKRRALGLMRDVLGKIKEFQEAMPRRRKKQPVSAMIFASLRGKKKPIQPRAILEHLSAAGYIGSPAVVYATLGRLVLKGRLKRDAVGGYQLPE